MRRRVRTYVGSVGCLKWIYLIHGGFELSGIQQCRHVRYAEVADPDAPVIINNVA